MNETALQEYIIRSFLALCCFRLSKKALNRCSWQPSAINRTRDKTRVLFGLFGNWSALELSNVGQISLGFGSMTGSNKCFGETVKLSDTLTGETDCKTERYFDWWSCKTERYLDWWNCKTVILWLVKLTVKLSDTLSGETGCKTERYFDWWSCKTERYLDW